MITLESGKGESIVDLSLQEMEDHVDGPTAEDSLEWSPGLNTQN